MVASLSRRAVQLAMGSALLVAALLMISSMIGVMPAGGTARAFTPAAFAAAIAASLLFGALLTIGIGNYAPSLIVFSLLGVDPRAAFPIMMGSGAFVATVAGVRFIRAGRFDRRAALGLTLGGVPGVLVAAIVVQSVSLETVRWLVVLRASAHALRKRRWPQLPPVPTRTEPHTTARIDQTRRRTVRQLPTHCDLTDEGRHRHASPR